MTENKTIRVMIVDDHSVVRTGLSAFFAIFPDLELVGEAENGEEALVRCGLLQPDVIPMDLIMPGLGGVNATQQIKEKYLMRSKAFVMIKHSAKVPVPPGFKVILLVANTEASDCD